VPDSRIAALYSGADLFVFPSFMEGFGLPPLEAMSCGVPVAATTRTSVPEVLGKSARYFDPADLSAMAHAMRSVLEDRALAEELKRRGAALCSSYSPARTSAAMVPVLDAARADKALRSR
jgi:glycosyltransferase involved in cell wall biosynthesis